MRVRPLWRRPYVAHAARVALVATVIIGALYVCVVASFNVLDRNRLAGQIDARLQQRLVHAAENPEAAGSIADYDNAHDVDEPPVFVWTVTSSGTSKALTPGAPVLPRSARSPSLLSVETVLGGESFRLRSERVGKDLIVAAQSLSDVDRIESDLLLLEAIAGPILLVAVFFGTLLVGIKAASPVELARRRQLNSRPTPLTSFARLSASSRPRSLSPSVASEVKTTTEPHSAGSVERACACGTSLRTCSGWHGSIRSRHLPGMSR